MLSNNANNNIKINENNNRKQIGEQVPNVGGSINKRN